MATGRSVFREYFEALLIAAIFLRFANTFVIQTFYIPSGSMEDTLLVGDHLFVNRFIYGPAATALEHRLLPLRPARRGDIVVFRSPENPTIDVVKRCIGLAGDKIEVVEKQLYINGKAVADSSYALHKDPRTRPPFEDARDNFGPMVVPDEPETSYFCMGDNRDNSYDSRYWGPLPAHLLKGRPLFIYWSYGGGAPVDEWEGAREKAREVGRTAAGFLTKTRWGRTFRLIR